MEYELCETHMYPIVRGVCAMCEAKERAQELHAQERIKTTAALEEASKNLAILPKHLIDKINNLLDIEGQPYIIDWSDRLFGQSINTGCFFWELPTELFTSPSYQELDPVNKISIDVQEQSTNGIDDVLNQVRTALASEPIIAYKKINYWISICRTTSRQIVVCPSTDQFDILRYEYGDKLGLQRTGVDFVIEGLEQIDESYGIDITGATEMVVEFFLKRIPIDEEAKNLMAYLRTFCYDIEQSEDMEDDIDLDNYDFEDGRVALWWD